MSIVLISFALVMKFTNSFLVSCRSISYHMFNYCFAIKGKESHLKVCFKKKSELGHSKL